VTVVAFPDPRVIREHRRCRVCGDLVLVFVMDGAFLPRPGHYTCVDHHDTPQGPERVVRLVEAESMPQLGLDDAA
jgi:hypothetical protein